MFRQDVFFLLTALGAGVRFAELFVFLFSIEVYVMSIVSIIQEYYYIWNWLGASSKADSENLAYGIFAQIFL